MARRVLLANPVSVDPINTGLAARWLGLSGQTGGSRLYDALGRYPGVNTNLPVWGVSEMGYPSLTYLAASTQRTDFGVCPFFDSASQLTFGGWFKRTASNTRITFGKNTVGVAFTNIAVWDDTNIYFECAGTSPIYLLNTTAWIHVVMVFDGTLTGDSNRLKGYVNGLQIAFTGLGTVGSTTENGSALNVYAGFYSDGSNYSSGSIADLFAYSRALPADQVWAIYNDSRMDYRQTLRRQSTLRAAKKPASVATFLPNDLEHSPGFQPILCM